MAKFIHFVLVVIAVLLIIASFLPFVETPWWAIRLLDFPRLQVGVALLIVGIALLFFFSRSPWGTAVLLAGVVAAIAADAFVLWPYRPGGENFVKECPAERRLTVMIANVLISNRNAAPLLRMVEEHKPDVFLAMETDGWWEEALSPLAAEMPHVVKKITGSYYGIMFFSRLPLVDPEIRFLAGRDTPSVITGVTLPGGETVRFLGLHPRPPLVWQSALERDAELYAAGFVLRDAAQPSVLAGDLNSTPWEKAVSRMRRIAHLIDPRRGYGYVPSFNAKSWWQKWPLDHIFYTAGFTTMSLDTLSAFGSDHYPYLVRLCLSAAPAGSPAPSADESDLAAARAVLARPGGEGHAP